MGILLSAGVIRGTANLDGNLGWRLPFMLQWIWPLPLLLVAYFAPESPWNAVRRGKPDLAKQSLRRLRGDHADNAEEVEATLAYIRYTTELEIAETEDATLWECFKGTNLRRTEIVSISGCFWSTITDTLRIASAGWQLSGMATHSLPVSPALRSTWTSSD